MGKKIAGILFQLLRSLECYFVLLICYLEIVIHMMRFTGSWAYLVYKFIASLFYGILLGALLSVFAETVSKILTYVMTVLLCLYFVAQIIYSGVFHTYLSLSGSIGVTGQALDFMDVILSEIKADGISILLLLLPVVLLFVWLRKKISFERHAWWAYILNVMVLITIYIYQLLIMSVNNKEMYSAYIVYNNYTSVDLSVEKLGVVQTLYLDAKAGLLHKERETDFMIETSVSEFSQNTGTEEAALLPELPEMEVPFLPQPDPNDEKPEPEKVDTSPNVLALDLGQMAEEETNKNIREIHQYVDTAAATNRNEYTGMFSGYNLIFITAEGFSGYMIDSRRTPTLYRLSHEGFYFKNYYTPLWYGSTLGGEYANLTGLIPKNGGYLSMKKSGKNGNCMLFTLSEQLKRQGYTVKGYHNNDYKYYGRNISHPNLGYDWTGVGNGYEAETNSYGNTLWPQSDLRMVQSTFDDYAGEEPFHTYYLTVSGHVLYDFGSNAMSARHKEEVADLPYSDTTKAYLACQYELELAMAELVKDLEEAGIADRTLIVLTADHVPYDNKDVLDELAGRELEDNFEWYKNTLIIWSASMEEPVPVDKYCCSLDVLPTVSNLMGLPYDSRMLAGQDILSDSEGLVIFNNRSFITDRCSYNSGTGKVISFTGEEIPEDYIKNRKAVVSNKFQISESICDYDYYKYIDAVLNSE